MSSNRPSPSGLSRFIKDPFCGLSHALGAVLSIVALIVMLVITQGGAVRVVALTIYGVSMIVLYTASTLAHSLHCPADLEERLNRFDYVAIFGVIAGTYTPLCLMVLRGGWGWSLLIIEWSLAIIGATAILRSKSLKGWPLLLYIPMGWLMVIAIGPLLRVMPLDAIIYLAAGGLLYTIGAFVFLTGRPKLFPGIFGSHDLWHVMVLLGSMFHFLMVMRTAV